MVAVHRQRGDLGNGVAMPYETWLQKNAPSYLQDAYGQAWMGGIGAALDDYVQQYIQGILAAFPDYAPSDALGVIGDEMGIDRGPTETDVSYAARLRAAWIYWQLAGTPLGLLVALYFAGYTGAYVVQQNGLSYTLSSAPSPGVDPTPLLTVTPTAVLASAMTPTAPSTHTIPAGTPWWTFDSQTDFCSRFAVLLPTGGVPSDLATLRRVIAKWRPAKATCVGIYAVVSGKEWGFPVSQAWGAATGNWGGNVTFITP